MKYIKVRNAHLNNLKNINVDIPRSNLTVITGVSGSGKSTLAFDTIYAEGQRRFVESLSSYARQFLERMNKPDVDSIEGLPPAVAIEQTPPSKNPRSTVGTSTEIYDYLRVIFGRIGKTYCETSGNLVKKDSPESVVKELIKWSENTKFYILFKIIDNTTDVKGEVKKCIENGIFRAVNSTDFTMMDIENEELPKGVRPDDFYMLVDRLILKHDNDNLSRLNDSIESAFTLGHGRISIYNLDEKKVYNFSNIYEDSESGRQYLEPEPKLFSFNNPYGACPKCQGFGRTIDIDPELIIPDKTLSLEKGAIACFSGNSHSTHLNDLIDITKKNQIRSNVPYAKLNEVELDIVWNGKDKYWGINKFFKEIEDKNYKVQNRVLLARYRGYTTCSSCKGSRLRTSARQVFVNDKNIPNLSEVSLEKLNDYINTLKLSKYENEIIGQVLDEIKWRLGLLIDIGLEYLTLNRLTHTLSGGEFQRINLSTALGSSLVGTLYVLDEPSTGMHPRDTNRLIKILHKLRNIGNTIIVVEHDPDIMKEANYILDIGPEAGENGGNIVFEGSYKQLLRDNLSTTAHYLNGKKIIPIPKKRRKGNGESLLVKNATENNLNIKEVKIPLGTMTLITGVSGSGKSTLVHDIIYGGIKRFLGAYNGKVGKFEKIEGMDNFNDIEMVDQTPIGKSSRSTPATYTKVFDYIREEYSKTQISKQMGLRPGYFSFNVDGGRCEACEGEGLITVDMQFLPDVKLPCESCNGTRYKRETRNILIDGKSIVDVLNMTINQATDFFQFNKKISNKLEILQSVGLGYLKLGQPSTMLSGGEAQRIKLAAHLESKKGENNIYIFDEPTTGLHLDDISKLIKCFNQLIEKGHTVLIIEHNMHMIASADHIIDLGPEAGDSGGEIVITGTPEKVAKNKKSYTAKALKEFFNNYSNIIKNTTI